MNNLDVIALFDMNDDENDRNNALHLMLYEFTISRAGWIRSKATWRKGQNYYEIIVSQYDNLLFKERFKMSRATFKI